MSSITQITRVCQAYPEIKLAYLFGSRASGHTGPLSDYDIGIYLDESLNARQRFDVRIDLVNAIGRELATDKVDVVVLNDLDKPALAYNIISGQLLVERIPYRLLVEPKILNNHFDFRTLLQRHKLTKARR